MGPDYSGYVVMPVTLDPLMSAGSGDGEYMSLGSGSPLSDRDIYVAVTLAWYRLFAREERRRHPLGPYVLGGGFTRSVAAVPVDVALVASACARIACRHPSQERGELLPVALEPHEAFDPAVAWWRELEATDGLGVHYVELGGGILEFLMIGVRDDRPDIEGLRI